MSKRKENVPANSIKVYRKSPIKGNPVKIMESRQFSTQNQENDSTSAERKKIAQFGNKIMEFPSFDLSMSKIELQSFIQQQDQDDQQSSQFGATAESMLKFADGGNISI